MALHNIVVTQVFRVERQVAIAVEAPTAEEAADMVDSGEVDKPEWSAWRDDWVLQSEEVIPA